MQMYSGTADWDKIAEVVNAVRIPVIGNGDVFTGTDAAALAAKTGCAGIMAARGAQGKPDGFTTVAWKTSNEVYHTSNTPPLTPLFPLRLSPFQREKI